jgi:hypothetical protein
MLDQQKNLQAIKATGEEAQNPNQNQRISAPLKTNFGI